MIQIERYIFWRTALISIAALSATTAIVLTTQLLVFVDVMSTTGQSLLIFGKFALMLLPALAIVVMPFALMLGAGQTLSNMNADSELVVIEAAGATQKVVAKPLLIIAVSMAALTLLLTHVIEPISNRGVRDILNNARGDLFSIAIQSGKFQRIEDGLYVQVAQKLPGGQLGGIFVSDRRENDLELVYYARLGVITEQNGIDLLLMSDGEVHRKTISTGDVSIIRFASYAFDFSQFSNAAQNSFYFAKERSTAYLLNPDPNDGVFQGSPELFREEIQRRFSEWMYPILFALVTIAFLGKAKSNRQEQFQSILTMVGIAFAFRGAGFMLVSGSGTSNLAALFCYLVPATGIAFFGFVLATGRTISLPQWYVERVAAFWAWVFSPAIRLARRFLPDAQTSGGNT